MFTDHRGPPPDYRREEGEAQRLDRNWAELVQELRVIGTGVQILFAFLLSIPFQARFGQTSHFERTDYLVTLLVTGLAAAFFIAPVALHRFLFRFGVKDELVKLTNALAVLGLAAVSLSMIGSIVLTCDWVVGDTGAAACGGGAAVVFIVGWIAFPLWLRRRYESRSDRPDADGRSR